jgi:hypothetical protein
MEHKDYIVDNLSTGRSIFEAYANSRLVAWRRSLANFGPKQAPCDSCRFAVMAEDPQTGKILSLAQAAL